ncbi:unnamed protein product, partial [Durusdinium trenchii]
ARLPGGGLLGARAEPPLWGHHRGHRASRVDRSERRGRGRELRRRVLRWSRFGGRHLRGVAALLPAEHSPQGPPSKLCSPRAPRSAASAADAAASSTVTEPVAEVPRAVRGRRGKHGVRSTLEENEGSREDVERKRTADTNTGDREGDKERRNEPKGAGSTGSMEKKSYYQAPAKGQGSGQRVWRPKV